MNPLSIFPQLPGEEGAITLRRAVGAYLDHLSLQVETNCLSRERMLNLARNLTRFVQAWSVHLADGRHVLVPLAEPETYAVRGGVKHRRRKLKWQAATAEEAHAEAKKIAAGMARVPALAPLVAGEPVRPNGDRPLAEFSNDDLTRWLIVNPQWVSAYSKHDALDAIIGCLAWYEDEFKVGNPFRRKRLPRFPKKQRREAATGEYVIMMGHRSSRQLRRALWCLYNVQGVRPGTMRGVIWPEFDWQASCIRTMAHKTARVSGKPLIIGLTPRQLRFFANLFRQRPPWPDNVFLNTDGKPWTRRSFALHLRRTAKRLGLDENAGERVTAYCFRHTFATQADEAGAARSDTKTCLNHKNDRMLDQFYSKAGQKPGHVRGAAIRIEQLRRQARKAQAKEEKKRRQEDEGLF